MAKGVRAVALSVAQPLGSRGLVVFLSAGGALLLDNVRVFLTYL